MGKIQARYKWLIDCVSAGDSADRKKHIDQLVQAAKAGKVDQEEVHLAIIEGKEKYISQEVSDALKRIRAGGYSVENELSTLLHAISKRYITGAQIREAIGEGRENAAIMERSRAQSRVSSGRFTEADVQTLRQAADKGLLDHEDINMSVIEGKEEAFNRRLYSTLERLEQGIKPAKKDIHNLYKAVKKGALGKDEIVDLMKIYGAKRLKVVLDSIAAGNLSPENMGFVKRAIRKNQVDASKLKAAIENGNKWREDDLYGRHYFL